MVTSRSIHVAAHGMISFFLWLSNIPLCVCVCVYTHMYIDTYTHTHTYIYIHTPHIYNSKVQLGTLGYMYHFKLEIFSFLHKCPEEGLLDHNSIFTF